MNIIFNTIIIIFLTINCWLKRAVNGCVQDKYKYKLLLASMLQFLTYFVEYRASKADYRYLGAKKMKLGDSKEILTELTH